MQFLGINLNSNQGNFLESITKKNKFNFESTTLDSLKKATQSCSIFIPEKESHNLGQIEDFLGLNLKHICILHDGGESYVNGLNLMAKSEKITTLLGEKYQFQNILEHETLSVLNYLTFEEWPSLFFFMDKFFKSGNNLLTDSYARYQAIEEVMKSSETFSVSTGVLNNLYSILDELLMNAIFDAHPTFSKTLRKKGAQLEDRESVLFHWGLTEETIYSSALDPHGRFKRSTLIDYLTRCYQNSSNMITYSGTGAGLGLFRITKASSSFFVAVIPEVATEASLTINFKIRPRYLRNLPKTLHFQVYPTTFIESLKVMSYKLAPKHPIEFKVK